MLLQFEQVVRLSGHQSDGLWIIVVVVDYLLKGVTRNLLESCL